MRTRRAASEAQQPPPSFPPRRRSPVEKEKETDFETRNEDLRGDGERERVSERRTPDSTVVAAAARASRGHSSLIADAFPGETESINADWGGNCSTPNGVPARHEILSHQAGQWPRPRPRLSTFTSRPLRSIRYRSALHRFLASIPLLSHPSSGGSGWGGYDAQPPRTSLVPPGGAMDESLRWEVSGFRGGPGVDPACRAS